MTSSLESTPPGPLSPESHLTQLQAGGVPLQHDSPQHHHHQHTAASSNGRRRKGSRTIEVMPYTTYCERYVLLPAIVFVLHPNANRL